jgi:hypothetical protein
LSWSWLCFPLQWAAVDGHQLERFAAVYIDRSRLVLEQLCADGLAGRAGDTYWFNRAAIVALRAGPNDRKSGEAQRIRTG